MFGYLAIIAAVLTVLSVVPYIRDILRGKTRPNIVSWFTWTLITGVATAAAFSEREYKTAILTLAATLATGTIFILGIKYGVRRYTIFDMVCQALALTGFALWQITDSANYAILLGVITDFIATLPTLRHSWLKPSEETWQTFAISSFAATLTIISLHSFNFVSLGFPIYLAAANALIAGTIYYRRTQLTGVGKTGNG